MPPAIDPRRFWGTNHYRHPPLHAPMIRAARVKLGVELPDEYLALLRVQNGGYTKGFHFPVSGTTWSADYVQLGDLWGIVTNPRSRSPFNVMRNDERIRENGLPGRTVAFTGDGHWFIALDYRKWRSPRVSWIDLEGEQDRVIAPSFAAFLSGLIPGECY